ncbi:IS6 family transposase [Cyanobacteria bacterium FACHB-502]|uniref:IS6 family transposase n=1 Tax=Leptolyngbya sp. GB1-A1 TaxID=2933908 RepID=UPI00199FED14|nr:IS6 family transposase [Cyanobacteria bacterium FACHB-502]
MNCPDCGSARTTRLQRTTNLGYALFRCKDCCRSFNERTGTPFNFIEVPTDIVFQVLLCRLRYKLSFRDIAEFFLLRGFEFTHETVRDWEERFAPVFAKQLRAKRKGKVGKIWFADETYIRVKGQWCYLYGAIDEYGNLVDVRLSKKRDMAAAKAFFAQAHEVAEQSPQRVVTDRLSSYPRAIDEELGSDVEHQVRGCLENPIEQSHRGIKQRYYPMLGFGAIESAKRFCQAFDEVKQFLRPRARMTELVSLSEQREQFIKRVNEFQELSQAI